MLFKSAGADTTPKQSQAMPLSSSPPLLMKLCLPILLFFLFFYLLFLPLMTFLQSLVQFWLPPPPSEKSSPSIPFSPASSSFHWFSSLKPLPNGWCDSFSPHKKTTQTLYFTLFLWHSSPPATKTLVLFPLPSFYNLFCSLFPHPLQYFRPSLLPSPLLASFIHRSCLSPQQTNIYNFLYFPSSPPVTVSLFFSLSSFFPFFSFPSSTLPLSGLSLPFLYKSLPCSAYFSPFAPCSSLPLSRSPLTLSRSRLLTLLAVIFPLYYWKLDVTSLSHVRMKSSMRSSLHHYASHEYSTLLRTAR